MANSLRMLGLCASFAALLTFSADQAAAQRAAGAAAGSRQVRSSASANVNRAGGDRINAGNVNRAGGGRVNTGNVNVGNRTNVNVNRNVNVNVDGHHHGCCWSNWDNHGGAFVAGAIVGATTAAVIGSYYRSLPPSCATIYRGSVTYYQCGSVWYQPVYSGTTVQYVVVTAP
jgi:hypothetical protein